MKAIDQNGSPLDLSEYEVYTGGDVNRVYCREWYSKILLISKEPKPVVTDFAFNEELLPLMEG